MESILRIRRKRSIALSNWREVTENNPNWRFASLAGESVDEYCGNELDVRDFEEFFIDSVADLKQAAYCERGPYDE